MNTIIRDMSILKSINPVEVANYLQTKGWQKQRQIDNISSIWKLTVTPGEEVEEVEIFLPLNPEFHDFAARMSDVLQTLQIVENRSQLEIINNFKNP